VVHLLRLPPADAVAAAVAAPTDVAARSTVTAPVVLYWLAFLTVGLSVSLLGPALSELRDRSGADIGSIGILFVGQSAGHIAGAIVAGRLYDRYVGHRVFAGSLFLLALAMLTVPLIDTLSPLFAVFFVIGSGAAGIDAGANTMLLWELGPDNGRAMNVLHLCFGLGALSAPLLVYGGVDLATRVAAATCVVFGIAALRVRSPLPRIATEDQEASPSPRLLALIASFFLLYVGLEVGFAGWVPTYAEEIGFAPSSVAWLTATFWIGFTAGRLLASAVAHHFRPKVILIGACALALVAAIVLLVGDGATAAVWFGTALMGVATAPQFPVMLSYLERRIHVTGYATSWFLGAAGVGGLIFPWLIGRWIDASGAAALTWSMTLLAIAVIVSFAASNRRLGG
jgi:fucose permease